MKKFNLEAAINGAPVITREGYPVRIICTDARGNYPIIALMGYAQEENCVRYTIDGTFYKNRESCHDLFMGG